MVVFSLPSPTPTRTPSHCIPGVLSPAALSDIGSLKSAHSTAVEESGGLALLTAVHASFPLAAVENYGSVLVERGRGTRIRLTRLFGHSGKWASVFGQARSTFSDGISNGLLLPAPRRPELKIDFTGDYTSIDFEEVEIDSLIKIAPPRGTHAWTTDPSLGASARLVKIGPASQRSLKPKIPVSPSSPLPFPPQLAYEDGLSTTSSVHYPPLATHYVIGESYGPLSSGAAVVTKPIQKLLQLERILCFLLAKERMKVSKIGSCVLGVIFIGPSIGSQQRTDLFESLYHYRTALKRLWALCNNGCFLSIRLQP